jgi:hypothetical protein
VVNNQAYRYKFPEHVDILDAELILRAAILAAEGLNGEAHVRMDAAYAIDESIRAIVVDASTAVGQDICAIFTRFLIAQYGQRAFCVRCVEGQVGCIGWEGGR